MRRRISILVLMMLCASCFSLNAQTPRDACPESALPLQEGMVLASGVAITQSLAYEAARRDLSAQVGEAVVETQFIKRTSLNKTEVESNASVNAKTHLSAHQITDETLICESGEFITYLLYDKRSLPSKILALMDGQKTRLSGPLFLVNSPLFAAHRDQASPHITYLNISYYQQQYELSVNATSIAISQAEFLQLLKVPSIQQNLLELSSLILTHNRPITLNMHSLLKEVEVYHVYLCSRSNECFLLHHNAHIGSAIELKTPYIEAEHTTLIVVLMPVRNKLSVSNQFSKPPTLLGLLTSIYEFEQVGIQIIQHQ